MQCCYTGKEKLFSDSDNILLLARWGGIQLEPFQGFSCPLPPPERQTLCLPVCPQNASLFGTHEWALGLQSWQLYHMWTGLRCFPEVLLNTYAFFSCIWGGVWQPDDWQPDRSLPPSSCSRSPLSAFLHLWMSSRNQISGFRFVLLLLRQEPDWETVGWMSGLIYTSWCLRLHLI